jgi:hypothetical protein
MAADVGWERVKSAERMRRHRERKREGFRCCRIEVNAEFVDALVRQRWLRPEERKHDDAVGDAICRLLDAAVTRNILGR